MYCPPLPPNESQRLQALRASGLLDSPAEERFDRLTRLASRLFQVPCALVSLVDAERQWFKSRVGIAVEQTARETSFCAHAICGDGIFEVTDALADPRFADNPLVLEEPGIRFYAGVPVRSGDGSALGTLCIIDDKPRQLGEADRQALLDLAACVGEEISSRYVQQLEEERDLFSQGPVVLFVWQPSAERPVAWVSENVQSVMGYTREELQASRRSFADLLHPEDEQAFTRVFEAVQHGTDTFEQTYRLRLKNGDYRWFYDYTKVVHGAAGEIESLRGYLLDQTQLKQSKHALAAERQRLADIIEGTRVGTWEWNVQTGATVFNERWAEIVGYRLEELQPVSIQTWLDLAHPEDLQASGEQLNRCFNRELDYYDFEARMKHRDGSWVWVHDRGKVVAWSEDGQPLMMSGTHADITDKKEAERAVADYANFQRLIFENLPAYLFVKDERFRIVTANSRMLSLFPPEHRQQVIGSVGLEHFNDAERQGYLREDELAFSRGFAETEETLTRPDGEVLHLWTKKIAFRAPSGERFILGVSTDITQLKKEATLRDELRKRLTVATSAAGIGIWVWDCGRGMMNVDDRMRELYGFPFAEEIAVDAWTSALHPNDRARVAQELQAALANQHEFNTQFRVILPGGRERHIQASAHVERDPQGRPLRLIGTNWDISESKRAEAELIRAKEAAVIAARTKSEFLANMSHEIRTPFNGVLGMIRLAVKEARDPGQRRRLELAERSARSLLTVINDILDFSKIEAGKLQFEQIRFSLQELLSETVAAHALAADDKALNLSLDAVGVEAAVVVGDPARLKQILNNLLGNAIKFTAAGDVAVSAVLKPEHADGFWLQCAVVDTGVGIEPAKLTQLFEPFRQGDNTTTRRYGGTGLGLTIVKQLCELMGGDIRVVSRAGKGSRFEFSVRLGRGAGNERFVDSAAAVGLPVLILDQNETRGFILERQLRAWGFAVEAGVGPALAPTLAALGEKPGMAHVFLDQHLMDSPELIQWLTQHRDTSVAILATSANTGPLHLQGFAKPLPTLPKPVTPVDLKSVLEARVDQPCPGGIATDACSRRVGATAVRVLLVEDNRVNQEVASGVLTDAGHQVVCAENGRDALELLQQSEAELPFDIIVMDCHMPVMDGYQAARSIRAGQAGRRYLGVPIIAVTANAMTGDREKCTRAGMNEYLTKPIDPEALLEAVRAMLAKVRGAGRRPAEVTTPQAPQLPGNVGEVWDRPALLDKVRGKPERLTRLLTLFIEDLENWRIAVPVLIGSGNFAELAATAHTIKGSAANLTCDSLSGIARDLENSAKALKATNCQSQAADLLVAMERVSSEFKRELTKPAGRH